MSTAPASVKYDGPHFFDPANPTASKTQKLTTVHTLATCWSFGPLEMCAEYSNDGIDVDIKLLGQRIGGGRLDQNNATISVGVDVGLAKTSVGITADFGAKELVVDGEVCTRNWHGGWDCSGFHAVILRW